MFTSLILSLLSPSYKASDVVFVLSIESVLCLPSSTHKLFQFRNYHTFKENKINRTHTDSKIKLIILRLLHKFKFSSCLEWTNKIDL